MEWTKELDYSMRRDIAAAETIAKEQGIPPKRVVLDYGVATKAVAEIERLKDVLWNHKALLAAAESAGRAVCDELDTARAELHACGLELQTCRATLEEERRDGDVQRAEIERLTAELAGQSKAAIDWREAAKRHMARAEALRPGLTEDQAERWGRKTEMALCGSQEQSEDARLINVQLIGTVLIRASRGEYGAAEGEPLTLSTRKPLSPGDVSVPRAILERLAKAAASDPDAREARWAAERILQQADLAAEPARTDPEAARRLADARAERDRLDAKFRSYDGGDRPQSPPASLIRDLRAAEERVRELEAK